MNLEIGQRIKNNQGTYYTIINKYLEGNLYFYDLKFDSGNILNRKYITETNQKKFYDLYFDEIVGKEFESNFCGKYKVISKNPDKKIGRDCSYTCLFEDGTEILARKQSITNGQISKPSNHLEGKIFSSNYSGDFLVLKQLDTIGKSDGSYQFKIRFLETNKEYIADRSQIINGTIYDIMYPNPRTHIYIGEGEYDLIKYRHIRSLLEGICSRCYDINNQAYINYGNKGVVVDNSWHNFQNFCRWYIKNSKWNIYGYELDIDKDIWSNVNHCDNKIYSSKTCLLIPQELNRFLVKDSVKCGVYIKGKKFKINNSYKYIFGTETTFSSFKEAKQVFAKFKYILWKENINKYKLPNNIKEILLRYDFSWSWIWENMTEEEILKEFYGNIGREI